ncbi:hypothetical protein QQS21_000298 [Conoideocrella luteorostrata]|uniref:F-box domain-containing protein n=1 Tax=Conoideocrella luteorostrata TaxID=1105319 RepID=A0AAJ0G2T7_9HYPO|nr:hypothetical protein QQS21_000298 [Conoideocrella luteorostrata]
MRHESPDSLEQPWSSDGTISRLTFTPELGLDGMIRNLRPAHPSTVHRESPSSLGQLDKLPTEILFLTFNLLDFRSLSRVLRLSLRGKSIIETLPVYQLIMRHAPALLSALGQTRLIGLHSSQLILHTLRSDQCVSCFEFGGFIFLPTCERICFTCLHENIAFWMISRPVAKKCFCLTEKQLKAVPIMHSIPGSYSVGTPPASRSRVYRLVSVKQAKQMAIELHGSPEQVASLSLIGASNGKDLSERLKFQRFREISLEPPGLDLSRLPSKENFGSDGFAGVASMRLPHLSDSGLDAGRLCYGCRVVYDDCVRGELPASVLSELVPSGISAYRPLKAMSTRLYSRGGFLEHVEHCYGAQRLLYSWTRK